MFVNYNIDALAESYWKNPYDKSEDEIYEEWADFCSEGNDSLKEFLLENTEAYGDVVYEYGDEFYLSEEKDKMHRIMEDDGIFTATGDGGYMYQGVHYKDMDELDDILCDTDAYIWHSCSW